MNYFKLFYLPEKFKINKKLLSINFYNLQLKYHPDLFLNASREKQDKILKKSIKINKGYATLYNDFKRARYLLFLHGLNTEQEDVVSYDKNFLSKQFFLYEELENLKESNFNTKTLDAFLKKLKKNINKYNDTMIIELNNENWNSALKKMSKLLFFLKIKSDLKKEQDIYKKK